MAKGGTYHDAGNGRFVPKGYAEKHPTTTVKITDGAKPTGPRDAGTGQFVTPDYADKHPRTTVSGD